MNDEKQPAGVCLAEVPRQMADLEHACERLATCIEKLEKRCAPAINSSPRVSGEANQLVQAALCPLASHVQSCRHRVEIACDGIDSLMARMEL